MTAPEFSTSANKGIISTVFKQSSTNTSNFPSAIKQKLYESAPVILKKPLKFKKYLNILAFFNP
jgi:hypothetical protein